MTDHDRQAFDQARAHYKALGKRIKRLRATRSPEKAVARPDGESTVGPVSATPGPFQASYGAVLESSGYNGLVKGRS